MADYSNVTIGGKRLRVVRLGDKVIWEAEPAEVQQPPEDDLQHQEKGDTDGQR